MIQIDDGWYSNLGDWEVNGKFPSGMAFKACSDLPDWLTPSDQAVLCAYLETDPSIEQIDWYRFRLDDQGVDFEHAVKPAIRPSSSWNSFRVERVAYLYEVIKVGLPAYLESLKK